MAYTKLQIYNLALTNIAVTASLANLLGTDPKTSTLNAYYEIARDQVLKDYVWNFALAYQELELTGDDCISPLYKYEFNYPQDCLSAKEIVSVNPSVNIDFEVATNANGVRVINSNVSEGTLKYTRTATHEANFTPEFVIALSWYLSFLICDAIGLAAKKENAMKIYTSLVGRAMTANANEGFENQESEANWLDARNN